MEYVPPSGRYVGAGGHGAPSAGLTTAAHLHQIGAPRSLGAATYAHNVASGCVFGASSPVASDGRSFAAAMPNGADGCVFAHHGSREEPGGSFERLVPPAAPHPPACVDGAGGAGRAAVSSFLASCGLENYVALFLQQGFDDMFTVERMEEQHMKELGMPPGHALKLKKKLEDNRYGFARCVSPEFGGQDLPLESGAAPEEGAVLSKKVEPIFGVPGFLAGATAASGTDVGTSVGDWSSPPGSDASGMSIAPCGGGGLAKLSNTWQPTWSANSSIHSAQDAGSGHEIFSGQRALFENVFQPDSTGISVNVLREPFADSAAPSQPNQWKPAEQRTYSEEVREEHFWAFANQLARHLSRGHESIRQSILSFLETQGKSAAYLDRQLSSSFGPFEASVGGEVQRIVVDISLRKRGDCFYVTYKSDCTHPAGNGAEVNLQASSRTPSYSSTTGVASTNDQPLLSPRLGLSTSRPQPREALDQPEPSLGCRFSALSSSTRHLAGTYRCTAASTVAIRAEASPSSRVLCALDPDDCVRIVEVFPSGWCRIDDDELWARRSVDWPQMPSSTRESSNLFEPSSSSSAGFVLLDGAAIGTSSQQLERLSDDEAHSVQWRFQDALEAKCAEANAVQMRRQPAVSASLRRKFVERALSYEGTPCSAPMTPNNWADGANSSECGSMDCIEFVRRVVDDLKEDFGFVLGSGWASCQEVLPLRLNGVHECEIGDLIRHEYTSRTAGAKGFYVEVFLGGGSNRRSTVGCMPASWHSRTQGRDGVQVFDEYAIEATQEWTVHRTEFFSIRPWLENQVTSYVHGKSLLDGLRRRTSQTRT